MNPSINKKTGVTLVELLVVIAIISMLTAILIPKIRMINKERNIREAARVVGSVFSNASQRAVNDGTAGVVIERNPNFTDADRVNYGATSLYVLRKVPVYFGDDENAVATRLGDYQLRIPGPLEQDENSIVLVNDLISVNFGSVKYRIIQVSGSSATPLVLTLSSGEGGPVLPKLPGSLSNTFSFVIHRQPRKLESSRVELPEGYLIDMRYSGPINPGADTSGLTESPRSWFHEIVKPGFSDPDLARTTQIIFDATGGIDRIYFYNPNFSLDYNPLYDPAVDQEGFIDSRIPIGSLYLFVAQYEIEPPSNHGVLDSPSNLWVSVNNTTGSANVGYNVPSAGATLGERILSARGIAQLRQSATQ